jgi:tetratricopeptide (TPR) repeat protein
MARRALELDPASARAQLARSLVAAVARWDWRTALEASERSLELAPRDADVWHWRGELLSALERHDEAIAAVERALELDPTSPVVNTALGWLLFRARRHEEAVAQSHRTIELFPGYYDAWDNLKWIQITLGNEAQAVEAWIRSEELDSGDGEGVRRAYEAGGLERLHRESIRRETERWERGQYQSPYDIVLEHAALGEVAEAMAWLERSFSERETDLTDLAVDPRLDPLRDAPRFVELLGGLGLPRPPQSSGQERS